MLPVNIPICALNVYHCPEQVPAACAKSGNLEMLQWVRSKGCRWDGSTLSEARLHGHTALEGSGCPEPAADDY